MVQVDRNIARNILQEMSTASVDLDQLSEGTGISKPVLLRRLAEGSFRMIELAAIAAVLECPVADLTVMDGAA